MCGGKNFNVFKLCRKRCRILRVKFFNSGERERRFLRIAHRKITVSRSAIGFPRLTVITRCLQGSLEVRYRFFVVLSCGNNISLWKTMLIRQSAFRSFQLHLYKGVQASGHLHPIVSVGGGTGRTIIQLQTANRCQGTLQTFPRIFDRPLNRPRDSNRISLSSKEHHQPICLSGRMTTI